MVKEDSKYSQSPYFSDIGIMALVPDRWNAFWETRHFILSYLSKYFHVVWCEPPYWREIEQNDSQEKVGPDINLYPGLGIYTPERWLPNIGRPNFLGHRLRKWRMRRAQNQLQSRGCQKIILSIWRPEFESALEDLNYDLSCYHIDDDYSFGMPRKSLEEAERRIASRVNQVFVTSPGLLNGKRHFNPSTLLVPNGVDYRAFSTPCTEPGDLMPIPHPRVGYVGLIKKQLNFPLLLDLARRHPDCSFVFVGPRRLDNEVVKFCVELSSMPNVYFLGPKPLEALPAYQQHMDVSLLCYKVDSYTQCVYPLKLHQYLASGRPIIGSHIRSLQDFHSVIDLAETSEEWSAAIKKALSTDTERCEYAERRRDIARQHDWQVLAEKIAWTLCLKMGSPYVEQFQEMAISKNVAEMDSAKDFSQE